MAARGEDGALFSPYWYKVRDLRPRLRPGLRVERRVERDGVRHVLTAPESGRSFLLTPAAWRIVGALDGRRSVGEIWRAAADALGDDLPGQDEVLRLLGQLHKADALNAGVAPALEELTGRGALERRRRAAQATRNPLAIRIPLLDPDRFLEATAPLVRPLFTVWGLLAWLAVMVWAGRALALHWDGLAGAVADRALAFDNLLIAACVFPVAKLIHELAHGWACRVWGGEVREVGLMLLVFIPVPYVDASSSAAFASRWRRIVVAAAGMMAEGLLAAAALFVWIAAEPGWVTAVAFNVMLVAGVSTVLFNGNPLLRFDAYFILCDLISVQNLGGRAGKWWGWLLHAKGFGLDRWTDPADDGWERGWFLLYGPAALAYRLWLTLTISLYVAQEYVAVGIAMAAWSIGLTLLWPTAKGLWSILTGPRVAPRRGRALAVTAGLVAAPAVALGAVPVPYGVVVEGVVTAPEGGRVLAGADGVVRDWAAPGARLTAGETAVTLEAPMISAEAAVLEARVAAARARLVAAEASDAFQIAPARAELGYLEREAAARRADMAALDAPAPRTGRFTPADRALVPGRQVRKGETLGWIVGDRRAVTRLAIPAERIDEVRAARPAVSVRFADAPFAPVEARVLRIAPESTDTLPSAALSTLGGGGFTLDPRRAQELGTTTPIHVAELWTLRPAAETPIGARVHARFDLGAEPLAPRIWRALRRTFLSRLDL